MHFLKYKSPETELEEILCELVLAESPQGSGADMPIEDIEINF